MHTERAVCTLSDSVFALHIQPKTTDRRVPVCHVSDEFMQRPIYSLLAALRFHVNALNPPEIAISPVAPFGRDHEGPCDSTIILRDDVEAQCVIPKQCLNSGGDYFLRKFLSFRFQCHLAVEVDQDTCVGGIRAANLYLVMLITYGFIESSRRDIGRMQKSPLADYRDQSRCEHGARQTETVSTVRA